MNIYMDDMRRRPSGFALARTTGECLLMLRSGPVDILSLDYDMGPEDCCGGEVAKRMVLEGLFPREIYLHTSSLEGRKEMYEILYPAVPAGTQLYNGPLGLERLQEIAAGAVAG